MGESAARRGQPRAENASLHKRDRRDSTSLSSQSAANKAKRTGGDCQRERTPERQRAWRRPARTRPAAHTPQPHQKQDVTPPGKRQEHPRRGGTEPGPARRKRPAGSPPTRRRSGEPDRKAAPPAPPTRAAGCGGRKPDAEAAENATTQTSPEAAHARTNPPRSPRTRTSPRWAEATREPETPKRAADRTRQAETCRERSGPQKPAAVNKARREELTMRIRRRGRRSGGQQAHPNRRRAP